MRKRTNIFDLLLFTMAFISFLLIGVQSGFAQWEIPPQIPGEYVGKWYGIYCPDLNRDEMEGMNDGTAFPGQKVIDSWGYKAKPIEEIKELLPERFYNIVSNPADWGDIRINETKYIPLDQYPGTHQKKRIAATEKNKGTCSIDEKGHIRGYINGFPFPDSEDGMEIAWNFVKARNYGEDCYVRFYVSIIDKRGHTRYAVPDTTYLWWNGRLHSQVPNIEPNPNNYDMFNHMGWYSPYDLRGMVNLVHRYDDPDKADDQWMYITALRRVRRMSSSQRWDKLPGGNDITYDSATGFQGKPTNYEWKYLGRKLLLAGRQGKHPVTEIKGKPGGTMADQNFQRVNTKMVEFVPKIVSTVSRAVMYLDPETWIAYYVDYFDKRGRPYLFCAHAWCIDEDGCVCPQGFLVCDVQRTHSSCNNPFQCYQNSDAKEKGIAPGYYEMNKLRNIYGGR